MSRFIARLGISIGLLLCALLVVSRQRDSEGFDRFHEIACRDAPPRVCAPTGRQVVLARQLGDRRSRPPQLATVRIETFSRSGRRVTHTDQAYCSMPDAHNFACRQVRDGGRMSNGLAPWRQVQGRLFNDGVGPDRTLYLNGLQYWRKRLFSGEFEPWPAPTKVPT
jgi:hypothetical protein